MSGIHDHVASTVALARVVLGGLDRTQENSSVRTASLVLLLDTLIELGSSNQNGRVSESTGKEVSSLMATFAAVREQHGIQS
jgi:hypothetical protein